MVVEVEGVYGDTGRLCAYVQVCVHLDDSIMLVDGHGGRRNGSNTTKT